MLGLVIAFGIAVRDLTGHHQAATVAPSAPPSAGLHTGLQAPPGPVGASFTLDDGGGNRYQVALVKVIDPARSAREASGKRSVGLVFRIKALAGRLPGEDANNDAVLTGTDGQDYQADLTSLAGYANFDHGVIRLSPGQTATGAVAFQLPDGVTAAQVQWTALSGFGSLVEWNVGG